MVAIGKHHHAGLWQDEQIGDAFLHALVSVDFLARRFVEGYEAERFAQYDRLAVRKITAEAHEYLVSGRFDLRDDGVVARFQEAGKFRDAFAFPKRGSGDFVDRIHTAATCAVDDIAFDPEGRVALHQG